MRNIRWRGEFDNPELNALHAEAFGTTLSAYNWEEQVHRHSLGWVTARRNGELVGFVNVAWDGGSHAFLLDMMVRQTERRQGLGRQIVASAVEAVQAAGCEWLHVDYEDQYESFYLVGCGFKPTRAGLIALRMGERGQ